MSRSVGLWVHNVTWPYPSASESNVAICQVVVSLFRGYSLCLQYIIGLEITMGLSHPHPLHRAMPSSPSDHTSPPLFACCAYGYYLLQLTFIASSCSKQPGCIIDTDACSGNSLVPDPADCHSLIYHSVSFQVAALQAITLGSIAVYNVKMSWTGLTPPSGTN
jgi:hypothetical protein